MNLIRMIRRRAIPLLLALALVAASQGNLIAGAASGDPPVDLAALALRPGDIDQPGFARFSGIACSTADGCAISVFLYSGVDEQAIVDSKLRRGYSSLLSRPEDVTADTTSDTIETTILEFADSAKAKNGLAMALAPLNAQGVVGAAPESLGAGAELLTVEGPVAGDDSVAGAAGIRFRSGRLVIGVTYRFAAGHAVDPSIVEPLAEIVANRLESAGDGTGFGARIVHVMPSSEDFYDYIDGTIQPTFFGFEGEDGYRATYYDSYQVTDVFVSNQIVIASNPLSPTVSLKIVIVDFATADAAQSLLDESAASVTGSGVPSETIEAAPALGDSSTALLAATENWYGAQYLIRVGTLGIMISWENAFPDPASSPEHLISAREQFSDVIILTGQAQFDCLSGGSCTGLLDVPADVMPQA